MHQVRGLSKSLFFANRADTLAYKKLVALTTYFERLCDREELLTSNDLGKMDEICVFLSRKFVGNGNETLALWKNCADFITAYHHIVQPAPNIESDDLAPKYLG